jgi:hypothetical protein
MKDITSPYCSWTWAAVITTGRAGGIRALVTVVVWKATDIIVVWPPLVTPI